MLSNAKGFYYSLYIHIKNSHHAISHQKNVKKLRSVDYYCLHATANCKKRGRLCAIYTVGSGGQLLRGDWAIAFNIRTSCEAGPSAPCSLHGSAATIAKMYRPIKMDSRFDPVHIIFHARRMRRYCDVHRGGAPGKSHPDGNPLRRTTKESSLSAILSFSHKLKFMIYFNGIRLVRRSFFT